VTPRGEIHVWRVREREPGPFASSATVRAIVGAHLGRPAEEIRVVTIRRGKPVILDGDGLCLGLAHTTGLALVALSFDREIGVDLEAIDPRRVDLDVADRFLPAGIAATLRDLPQDDRVRAFLAAWTRREAEAKGMGAGLDGPPADAQAGVTVEVPVGPDHVAAIWAAGTGPVTLRVLDATTAIETASRVGTQRPPIARYDRSA
jgi:phosphopantetheinyl transferase